MLSVTNKPLMLSVIRLNAVMQSVIVLSVVAPFKMLLDIDITAGDSNIELGPVS